MFCGNGLLCPCTNKPDEGRYGVSLRSFLSTLLHSRSALGRQVALVLLKTANDPFPSRPRPIAELAHVISTYLPGFADLLLHLGQIGFASRGKLVLMLPDALDDTPLPRLNVLTELGDVIRARSLPSKSRRVCMLHIQTEPHLQ